MSGQNFRFSGICFCGGEDQGIFALRDIAEGLEFGWVRSTRWVGREGGEVEDVNVWLDASPGRSRGTLNPGRPWSRPQNLGVYKHVLELDPSEAVKGSAFPEVCCTLHQR